MEREGAMLSSARQENSPDTLENGVMELEGEKRRLEKRLQETKEVLVCRVCLDRPVAAVFMPCAHLSTCVTCSASLTTCPLCRSPIHYAAPVIL
ncbi:baculoviral IAP repeat-containing protein 8-like [Scylla paramamosain]|uniref:baculoviral IAP repeat-containing protein 8-like n=1 Tax=Scylla paramamosain TaxID=85552 RepID=UPI003082C7AA